MAENVLGPIGMAHSTFEQPLPAARLAEAAAGHDGEGRVIEGKRHTYPEMAAAGLWTTPSDLLRYGQEILRIADGAEDGVLSPGLVIQMLSPAANRWGLGPTLSPEGTFGHGGSNAGFKCQMVVYLDTGDGAAIMTNGDQGSALASELLRAISQVYDWPDYKPSQR